MCKKSKPQRVCRQCVFHSLMASVFHSLMAKNGGCIITETEQRSISLKQLQQIAEHIRGTVPWAYEYKGKTKIVEDAGQVCLYDVNAVVIKPVTKKRECSMVELMATAPQPPE